MDYVIAATVRFTLIVLLVWWPVASHGAERPATFPTDECANAFAKFKLMRATTVSVAGTTWNIDSVQIRDGYDVDRLVSTLPPKKKANRITAILQKKQNGQTGVYEVAAVCLENKKDMDSKDGRINFYSEKGVNTPIYFWLKDGEEVTWPATKNEAVYLKEYQDGEPLPTPRSTDWMVCKKAKVVHKRAIGKLGGVVWFRMCQDVTRPHLYEYVLRLYQVINGAACYSDECLRPIDPQIIHQPR